MLISYVKLNHTLYSINYGTLIGLTTRMLIKKTVGNSLIIDNESYGKLM